MNPRMKQLTRATPQPSRRSMREIVADEGSGENVVFVTRTTLEREAQTRIPLRGVPGLATFPPVARRYV
jgi:hypothetical protein